MNHLLKPLGKEGLNALPEAFKEKDNRAGLVKVGLAWGTALLLLILFAGAEGVKAAFRKHYIMSGTDLAKLILCFFCFLGTATLSFFLVNSKDSFASATGSSDSHFVTGLLFIMLAGYILIKGINNYRKKCVNEGLGTSLFKKHSNEPIVTLFIGAIFSIFNLIGGAVIFFCGLSVWVNSFIQTFFVHHSSQENVVSINKSIGHTKTFKDIIP